MKTFAVAMISAVTAVEFGYDEYPHAHTEYGEETRFRDVEVIYDEIEYWVETR